MSEVFEALPPGLPSLRSPGLEQGQPQIGSQQPGVKLVSTALDFLPRRIRPNFEGAVITRCCILSNPWQTPCICQSICRRLAPDVCSLVAFQFVGNDMFIAFHTHVNSPAHHTLLRLLSPPLPEEKTSATLTPAIFPVKPLPLLLVLDVGDVTVDSLP
jgi:hypothetical protein